MLSKKPRFPYEALSAEDLEEILCKCGIANTCECPTGQEKKDNFVICQGKVKKRIFKGPTPRSILGDESLSTPSRRDHGFEIRDGVQHRLLKKIKEECVPFYDVRINESTAFYRGCKWSKRTASIAHKVIEINPGPGDYGFEREPTKDRICIEKIRAHNKSIAKQLRFMDLVYEKNLSENRPGPATYYPKEPKGTNLSFIGSKEKRFPVPKYEVSPGPADHWLRRDFDPIESTGITCHAVLPNPPCFGTKSERFSNRGNDGPDPASYNTRNKLCNYVHCKNAPFGISAKRFKEEVEEENYTDELEYIQDIPEEGEQTSKSCIPHTWEFKSKTIRMKPLLKKYNEPSPADLPQNAVKISRSLESQFAAPFFSSEGRFKPWHCWIPVHGKMQTPGPATYCLSKPKCLPAFNRGPLYRTERFPKNTQRSPAPNKYYVNCGIGTILSTHNQRLKNNIKNQYKFHWEPSKPKKKLSYEEKEDIILQQTINLLNLEGEVVNEKIVQEKELEHTDPKPKMLKSFLYAHPLPNYF
ncbi:hypothetical protein HW555_010600 [Spodoptera exigua]|uniref:Uncharacterized protein n=1 Tax=Spodoptera exigua TaxID=7107 RepID=A0A835G8Q3_SPOEX|nr:hypothetical protein HW555_010600 [Spodoptera exigua]